MHLPRADRVCTPRPRNDPKHAARALLAFKHPSYSSIAATTPRLKGLFFYRSCRNRRVLYIGSPTASYVHSLFVTLALALPPFYQQRISVPSLACDHFPCTHTHAICSPVYLRGRHRGHRRQRRGLLPARMRQVRRGRVPHVRRRVWPRRRLLLWKWDQGRR